MNIEAWQKNWDELGKGDPLWVVLTDPDKKNGGWDAADFFATGQKEIDGMLLQLDDRKACFSSGRALDFGCGVGRLSRALSAHFKEVVGVDISPSMIEHAKSYNQDRPNCSFVLNSASNLEILPSDSFDFIYSNIVLQHIEPRFSKCYLKEFCRVLKPGGVLVFQILSATLARGLFPQSFVDWYRQKKHKGVAFIPMFGVAPSEVHQILADGDASVLSHEKTGFGWRWDSHIFYVRKN